MSSHAAPRRRSIWRTLKSTRVRAILSLGIVLGFGAVSTSAYWTDQATVTGGTFTAGTLDLQLNDEQGKPDPYTMTSLGMDNMIPGSSVAVMLPVQNKSVGAKLTYTMTGGASGPLGAALQLQVFRDGTASNANGVGSCSSTAAEVPLTTLTNTNTTALISTAQGPLNPLTGVDNLCFRVSLPSGAATALQGASSAATFIFTATSVAPS